MQVRAKEDGKRERQERNEEQKARIQMREREQVIDGEQKAREGQEQLYPLPTD